MTVDVISDRITRTSATKGTTTATKFKRRLVFFASIAALWTVLCIIVPWLSPYSTTTTSTSERLQGPSGAHLLGTDDFGRDLLTRMLAGGRTSLEMGVTITLCAGVLGTIIGMVAGYFKLIRNIFMRIIDAIMSIPSIVLAIAAVAVIGGGQWQITAVLVIAYIPLFARIAYGECYSISRLQYVESTKLIGASSWRILIRHVFPNLLNSILVQATFVLATSILTAAALDFLGAGVQPPTPSIGGIIHDGYALITVAWWIIVFPGVFLSILVVSVSLAGDALSDFLDSGRRKGKL